MPFASIRGHRPIIDGLEAAVSRARVSHAYLFSGPDGVGKELVALAFFQRLNCLKPTPADACGTCRICRQFAEGKHPDVVRVERDGQFIKIKRIREVTGRLRFPPVEAAHRCILVSEAEWMNEPAANAILKTLEEPNARNIFILLTSQPNRLLPTIRSRCQEVRFNALPSEDVAAWLRETHELTAAVAEEIAAMSHGSLGRATMLLDPDLSALREEWLGVLDSLAESTDSQILELAERLATQREQVASVLDVLRMGLRDVLLAAAGASKKLRVFGRRKLPTASRRAALAALGCIDEAEESLVGFVSPRMVAEHLLLGLRRAFRES